VNKRKRERERVKVEVLLWWLSDDVWSVLHVHTHWRHKCIGIDDDTMRLSF